MPWSAKQDRTLLAYFQELGSARRTHGWHDANRRLAALDARQGTLAYRLDGEAGSTVVVVNADDQPRALSVDAAGLAPSVSVSVGEAQLRRDDDRLLVELGPRGSALIS